MNEMTCPWCEVALELQADQKGEQQCPECLTSWRYEYDYEQGHVLAAAA
jgi:uncharacterized Zn-finger protein